MKTVDLNKILEQFNVTADDNVLLAMTEACNQAIDLCKEKAKAVHYTYDNPYSESDGSVSIGVDRVSILKVKKLIISTLNEKES